MKVGKLPILLSVGALALGAATSRNSGDSKEKIETEGEIAYRSKVQTCEKVRDLLRGGNPGFSHVEKSANDIVVGILNPHLTGVAFSTGTVYQSLPQGLGTTLSESISSILGQSGIDGCRFNKITGQTTPYRLNKTLDDSQIFADMLNTGNIALRKLEK